MFFGLFVLHHTSPKLAVFTPNLVQKVFCLFVCLFLYALHHTPAKHLVFMPHSVKQNLFLRLAIASGRTEVFGEDILFFRECFIRQQNVHTSVICDANILFGPIPKMKKSYLVSLYDISAHKKL